MAVNLGKTRNPKLGAKVGVIPSIGRFGARISPAREGPFVLIPPLKKENKINKKPVYENQIPNIKPKNPIFFPKRHSLDSFPSREPPMTRFGGPVVPLRPLTQVHSAEPFRSLTLRRPLTSAEAAAAGIVTPAQRARNAMLDREMRGKLQRVEALGDLRRMIRKGQNPAGIRTIEKKHPKFNLLNKRPSKS